MGENIPYDTAGEEYVNQPLSVSNNIPENSTATGNQYVSTN